MLHEPINFDEAFKVELRLANALVYPIVVCRFSVSFARCIKDLEKEREPTAHGLAYQMGDFLADLVADTDGLLLAQLQAPDITPEVKAVLLKLLAKLADKKDSWCDKLKAAILKQLEEPGDPAE